MFDVVSMLSNETMALPYPKEPGLLSYVSRSSTTEGDSSKIQQGQVFFRIMMILVHGGRNDKGDKGPKTFSLLIMKKAENLAFLGERRWTGTARTHRKRRVQRSLQSGASGKQREDDSHKEDNKRIKRDIDMASKGAKNKDYSSIEIQNSNNRLVTSVRGMIDALPPISLDHYIYRALQCVRQLNEKAYTPRQVLIGPLHHGKENLLPMEEQKLRYLSSFLDRTKLSLEDCIRFVRGLEQRVRECYVESINLSSDEFVKTILIDSSFVVEVIWRTNFLMKEDQTDYLSKPISLVDVVRRDMILLENQIPHFVIASLFNLAPHHPKTSELSFVGLSIRYFGYVSLLNHIPQTVSESEVKHFVDLLRLCHLPSTLRSLPQNGVEFVTILTARDLQQVGLSIKKGRIKEDIDKASQGAKSKDYSSIEIQNSNSRLVTSVRGMIDALPPISLDHYIYRAPQCVCQLNEKAYTSRQVLIGPLHHGKENLLPMEDQKLRYLSSFLDRTKLSLEDCIRFVRGLEQRVRDYYVESINLSSDEFVKTILVNSSFVIEVIWRTNFLMKENKTDYLSKPISLVDVVRRDMILLENQIPHFVIASLFNLAPHHPKTSELFFVGLSIRYFGYVSLLNLIPHTILESEVKHFVDLLRLCHLPSTLRSLPQNGIEFVTIPTARDL
ncbi:hypothetical protein RHGRI_005492 [Rhododendron griersonianum]|uniref:Uncharacterized protein n=1 Tax=Rhododendron griersonianum TaxID=479676 RepID=A0AAV6LEF5_9ERIC|nr:hypothetical protein RHGRI_005492 [Rhododendron griersonianum]